jgi:hypothetical protein
VTRTRARSLQHLSVELARYRVQLVSVEHTRSDCETVFHTRAVAVHFNVMTTHRIPDIRDGLTREQRVVLHVLNQLQQERGDRNVPTAMLWGRVCEYFYISPEDLSEMLAQLGARKS